MLHVIGMAWTTNMAFGAFDLEVKAAFLLFPGLGVVVPTRSAVGARPLLTVLVIANAVAALLCLLLAGWAIAAERLHPQAGVSAVGLGHLFESRFAHFLHPSYMALYFGVRPGHLDVHWRWEAGRPLGACRGGAATDRGGDAQQLEDGLDHAGGGAPARRLALPSRPDDATCAGGRDAGRGPGLRRPVRHGPSCPPEGAAGIRSHPGRRGRSASG